MFFPRFPRLTSAVTRVRSMTPPRRCSLFHPSFSPAFFERRRETILEHLDHRWARFSNRFKRRFEDVLIKTRSSSRFFFVIFIIFNIYSLERGFLGRIERNERIRVEKKYVEETIMIYCYRVRGSPKFIIY